VEYLLIGIGGILGANARYWVADWAAQKLGTEFPYGTLIINVSGSFILGLFMAFLQDRAFIHPNPPSRIHHQLKKFPSRK
jgi:CrcB protein